MWLWDAILSRYMVYLELMKVKRKAEIQLSHYEEYPDIKDPSFMYSLY